ncbi:MAG: hypothetical protein FD126_400 [Elusimicrobia bacterium]|nr:MAG: hypothetical protein FD126_400 [Elusimicrobiota bacterium]
MTLSPLLALALAAHAAPQSFGAPLTLEAPVPLSDALAKPDDYKGKEILLEGTVKSVCKKKGCWLVLDDGERDLRITFKDYGFFVPKDIAGKKVRAQGLLSKETQSAKTVKHFLKDEGASKEKIKAVKGPVDTVTFVASGVTIPD